MSALGSRWNSSSVMKGMNGLSSFRPISRATYRSLLAPSFCLSLPLANTGFRYSCRRKITNVFKSSGRPYSDESRARWWASLLHLSFPTLFQNPHGEPAWGGYVCVSSGECNNGKDLRNMNILIIRVYLPVALPPSSIFLFQPLLSFPAGNAFANVVQGRRLLLTLG